MASRSRVRIPASRVPAGPVPAMPAATRIDSLTGLRGLAALAVFVFHAWQFSGSPDLGRALSWLMGNGWSGVDVFFTLSAFLLALPYARAAVQGRPAPDSRRYLLRRAVRILPAYWVQLALLLAGALAGLAWGLSVPPWRGWDVALAHVVLWFDAWPRIFPLLPHWWTLPVEFGFYLLLPWLARAFAPRRWPWLLGLVVLAWAWRVGWQLYPRADFAHRAWLNHLPGRIDQFAIGMLAAWTWVRFEASGRTLAPRRADALLVAGLLVFLAMPALLLLDGRPAVMQTLSLHPVVVAWHGLASVVVCGILIACVAGAPLAARLLAARPVRGLGNISYSLYLWHVPAIWWVLWQSGGTVAPADFWPFFATSLLLSIALAALSWWFVERPAQAWAARG
jgi:peptidoglycan/LPS O-acetylase OafA/YrhL